MVTSEMQAERYLKHLTTIMETGTKIYPRGLEVREVADLQLDVDPRYPFMTFKARKYDVNYFKKEMCWKLGASQYDQEIMKHAKMWGIVRNPDNTFNSNYGQYWFGAQSGLWSVVTELIRDPDSRRAVIPMLNAKHLEPWVVDTVCTEAVGFRIRDGKLHCSVHMRSSDSVYGLGTDIATFSFLMFLVHALITPSVQESVGLGEMKITAMSSHIYSTHYKMVDQMLSDGIEEFDPVSMPKCEYDEAMYLVSKRGKGMNECNPRYALTRWLIEQS